MSDDSYVKRQVVWTVKKEDQQIISIQDNSIRSTATGEFLLTGTIKDSAVKPQLKVYFGSYNDLYIRLLTDIYSMEEIIRLLDTIENKKAMQVSTQIILNTSPEGNRMIAILAGNGLLKPGSSTLTLNDTGTYAGSTHIAGQLSLGSHLVDDLSNNPTQAISPLVLPPIIPNNIPGLANAFSPEIFNRQNLLNNVIDSLTNLANNNSAIGQTNLELQQNLAEALAATKAVRDKIEQQPPKEELPPVDEQPTEEGGILNGES